MIVFVNMIADMLGNKKLNPVVTELSIRDKTLDIFFICIVQCYFAAPKNISLNFTHYFNMKISYKWELQQIAFNHSSDNDFRDFINLYKKLTSEPYSF